jgi:nitrite reductase/ring-hydroxylating ferredoxin subunit
MKKYIMLFCAAFLLSSCSKDKINNNNPYIPNYSFSVNIDTNLPIYNSLNFVSNGKYIPEGGASGIIVFNTGSGYAAFDAACPNQSLSTCSTMTVSGINAVCSCDSTQYNLFSGQSPGKQFPMKPYRVELNGTIIHVYN